MNFGLSLVNYNTYHPVSDISYSNKIKAHANMILDKGGTLPIIITNETIAGRENKYLSEISSAFKDLENDTDKYDIITPPNWNPELHPKSIFTSIMVPTSVKHSTLPHIRSRFLRNRFVAEEIIINNIPITVIAVHMVQTAIFSSGASSQYIIKRKQLQSELWMELKYYVKAKTKEPTIVCGDFQERSDGKNMLFLKELGYRELFPDWMPTTNNEAFPEKNIDHILFSPSAFALLKQPHACFESAYYTDHAILTVQAEI